ncbi:hypothetical protein AB0899_21810 [Streptomyces sp. NPDC007002]
MSRPVPHGPAPGEDLQMFSTDHGLGVDRAVGSGGSAGVQPT